MKMLTIYEKLMNLLLFIHIYYFISKKNIQISVKMAFAFVS